jgi:hypothetical protein
VKPATTIRRIMDAVKGNRFNFANEWALQEGLAAAFGDAGLFYRREVCLGQGRADRIDFMVEGIGVEVKCQGSATAVRSQLLRYLAHPEVLGLLLISTYCYSERAVNQGLAPPRVKGKPVRSLILFRGLQG